MGDIGGSEFCPPDEDGSDETFTEAEYEGMALGEVLALVDTGEPLRELNEKGCFMP